MMHLSLVPQRTLDQRMIALQRANDVRTRRARLKRDLHAGRAKAVDVIARPPEWALTMKVRDVLLAVPKVGRVKADKAMARAKVSPSKTLGGMTDRQRDDICERLGLGVPRRRFDTTARAA